MNLSLSSACCPQDIESQVEGQCGHAVIISGCPALYLGAFEVRDMANRLRAFTLVEILVVVIILGILAAIVIPQFSTASDEARESAVRSNLRSIRNQLQVYRVAHLNNYPDAAEFVRQMTTRTDADGAAGGTLGPYLQKIPTNAFNDKSSIGVEAGVTGLGDNSHGWHYDTTTGNFYADDSVGHAAW